ncbi:hypothetical protein JW926_05560 [Candidatus Sumerlaeota bacterium]|nr:hypothetical protein [Candidatus Sumerlaeota bacterium]
MMKNPCPTRIMLLLLLAALLLGVSYAQSEAADAASEHVIKVLRTTNKAQVVKYVPKVYDFNKVNPTEVVNFFTTALAVEEGGAYSFMAPDKKSGKILVICPEHQIPYFDKLAKELDRTDITSAPGSKYIYYRLKHRSAGDLGMLKVLANYGGELPVVAPVSSRPGQALQADFETNSLLLYGAPSDSDGAEKALKEILDVPTPQVELQVKIYEVNVSETGNLGLDYTDWKNGPGALLMGGEYGGERFVSQGQFFSNQWSYTGGYYIDYPSAYFDFLVVKNKAKVITEANIAAISGSPALLYSSEQYLYFSKSFPTYPSAPDRILNDDLDDWAGYYDREIDMVKSPVYVGVDLDVLPIIGEQNVDLTIDMSVDNVTGFADGYKSGYLYRDMPIVNSREFSDRINVPMGKEVVISGMTRERVVNHTKKIPILGSIPVLGWLFGGESARTDKTMVVAVVKPVSVKEMDNFMEDDNVLVSKATGASPITLPVAKAGFDQWLLDSEK